jgi:penicillin-binding protein 2
VPTYAVKLRPADLPQSLRPEVVERLAALLDISVSEINASIDSNPGSNFDLVRIAGDVNEQTALLISEASFELPGVEIAVEARRQYAYGPLLSQILGYTGPVSAEQLPDLRPIGYLPDDLLGKTGLEAQYETELRGIYGAQTVERDATGRRTQVLQTISEPSPGDSLNLTIDVKEQKYAETALKWAMAEVGLKRGVVIVMNPQTGEIVALVSLPTYDNNLFARGISAADYQALVEDPDKPLLNHATRAASPTARSGQPPSC